VKLLNRRASAASSNPEPLQLGTRAIYRNLVSTADGVWAWFQLSPVRWAFQSASDREGIVTAAALRVAELAEVSRQAHLRITAHPIPHSVWAKNLHDSSPNRLPDVEGAESWRDMLLASQHRIIASRLETPGIYIGVHLTGRKLSYKSLRAVTDPSVLKGQGVVETREKMRLVTEIMSREGFNGTPVTARDYGWLLHKSIAPGVEVAETSLAATGQEGWTEDDMAVFTEPVRVFARPLAGTVEVHALRDAAKITSHVAFLSMSRMDTREPLSPAFSPWLAFGRRLPFAVEYSAILDLHTGAEMVKSASRVRFRAKSIDRHYRIDHDEEPPPAVERAIVQSGEIVDEVSEGSKEVAARVSGAVRMAVYGSTADQALANARALISAYSGTEQKIELTHPMAQYSLYREFIPGEETHDQRTHVRWMPAMFFGAGVPNSTATLGDGEGPYLGQMTGGGRGAVMFDPTWGPRHDKSGLGLVPAGLGSGKSVLGGTLVDGMARRGYRSIVNDPSGALARMCELPHLRPYARHTDLTGAEPGTLNVYRLIPEPKREFFDSEKKWEVAVLEAKAERKDLTIDTFRMLLEDPNPGYSAAITDAVNQVGGEFGTNPWEVVYELEKRAGFGREVAAQLRAAAQLKGGILIFPDSHADQDQDLEVLDDAILHVLTMSGITPPMAGTDRRDWTRQERMAVPILYLAGRYTQRAMYGDQEPKLIVSDEISMSTSGGSSYRSTVLRGSRDSRKFNAGFVMLMQVFSDALHVSGEISNLVGWTAVGRMENLDSARATLPALMVPPDHGYERVLTTLKPGTFVMRDFNNNVDLMTVDLSHRPHMQKALFSTPSSGGRRTTRVEDTIPYEAAFVGAGTAYHGYEGAHAR